MYQDFETHKKTDSVKWIIVFTSLILLTVLVVGAITQGFTTANPYGWLDKKDKSTNAEPIDKGLPITDENGDVIDNSTAIAMPAFMTFASAQSIDGSDSNFSSVVVNANIEPADAYIDSITYSVAFQDGASVWAKGKTVTDYVTATQSETNNKQATIKCLKPFGEKIKVTVTVKGHAEDNVFTADCVIDFMKRIVDYQGHICTSLTDTSTEPNITSTTESFTHSLSLDDFDSFKFTDFRPVYSDYTVENPNFKLRVKLTMELDPSLSERWVWDSDNEITKEHPSAYFLYGIQQYTDEYQIDMTNVAEDPNCRNAFIREVVNTHKYHFYLTITSEGADFQSISGKIEIIIPDSSWAFAVTSVALDKPTVTI